MITALLFLFFIGFVSFLTPTGPITILIFRSAMLGKNGRAIMITFGAGTVQFFFCLVSLIIVSEIISGNIVFYSRILSAAVFLVLGVYLFVSKHEKSHQIIRLRDLPGKEKFRAFLLGFLVTILNVGIILSWLAVNTLFISFGLIQITSSLDIILLSLSAMAGIIAGAFLMILLVHKYREIFSDKFIDKLMKLLGLAITALSLYLFYAALFL